jgi:hypothetical protein
LSDRGTHLNVEQSSSKAGFAATEEVLESLGRLLNCKSDIREVVRPLLK